MHQRYIFIGNNRHINNTKVKVAFIHEKVLLNTMLCSHSIYYILHCRYYIVFYYLSFRIRISKLWTRFTHFPKSLKHINRSFLFEAWDNLTEVLRSFAISLRILELHWFILDYSLCYLFHYSVLFWGHLRGSDSICWAFSRYSEMYCCFLYFYETHFLH